MQGIQFQENFIQRLPAGLSVEQIIHQLAQPWLPPNWWSLILPIMYWNVRRRTQRTAYRTTVCRHSAHGP